MESINTSKGIVFIYSDYLRHGVRATLLVFKANLDIQDGLQKESITCQANPRRDKFCATSNKYSSKSERDTVNPAKYILLDSNVSTNELDELVKQARGETSFNNLIGEHIKVILKDHQG